MSSINLVERQFQKFSCNGQNIFRLRPLDRWKIAEEFLQRGAPCKILEERVHRNARALEEHGTGNDLRIGAEYIADFLNLYARRERLTRSDKQTVGLICRA